MTMVGTVECEDEPECPPVVLGVLAAAAGTCSAAPPPHPPRGCSPGPAPPGGQGQRPPAVKGGAGTRGVRARTRGQDMTGVRAAV